MGQYYITINLDKEQYIDPNKFNNGLKLLEFGCSGTSTMTALAILLSDGNGRGGGDLHIDGIEDGTGIFTLANEIIGSWAGNSIVVAGDYADPKKFINRKRYKASDLLKIAKARYNVPYQKASNVNLYDLANERFEDISYKILAVMCIDSWIRENLIEMYKESGFDSFKRTLEKAAEINPDIKLPELQKQT